MTELCKIENGVVTNRAHFDGAVPDGWVQDAGGTWIQSDTAQIGWTYTDGVFSPPPAPSPPPPTVPNAVTKLQLVRALRQLGKEEIFWAALAGADVTTNRDWSLAVEITRTDPLVTAFAQGLGLSSDEIDQVFILAATLNGG